MLAIHTAFLFATDKMSYNSRGNISSFYKLDEDNTFTPRQEVNQPRLNVRILTSVSSR